MATKDDNEAGAPADGNGPGKNHTARSNSPHDANAGPGDHDGRSPDPIMRDELEYLLRELTEGLPGADTQISAPQAEMTTDIPVDRTRDSYGDNPADAGQEIASARLLARKLAASQREVELRHSAKKTPGPVEDGRPGNRPGEVTASDNKQPRRPGRRRTPQKFEKTDLGSQPKSRNLPSYKDRSRVQMMHGQPAPRRISGFATTHRTGLAVLLLVGIIAAFGLFKSLNRQVPDQLADVIEPKAAGEVEPADQSLHAATDPLAGAGQTANMKSVNRLDQSEDAQAGTVTSDDQPDIAVAEQPTSLPADSPAKTGVGTNRIASMQDGEPANRIQPESAARTPLNDPEKPALLPAQESAGVENATEFDADQITTGAINNIASGKRNVVAVDVIRRNPAVTTEATENPLERSVDQGVTSYMPVGNEADFDALAATSMQFDPPIPDVRPQAPISRLREPERDDGRKAIPPNDVNGLLARGHERLQRGEITTARLLFRRVLAMGDSRGAEGMGMTYDPEVYSTIPVFGLTPDHGQAALWYRKARALSDGKVADAPDRDIGPRSQD